MNKLTSLLLCTCISAVMCGCSTVSTRDDTSGGDKTGSSEVSAVIPEDQPSGVASALIDEEHPDDTTDNDNTGSSEVSKDQPGGAESVLIEKELPLISQTGSSIGNVGELVFAPGDKIAEITIRDFGTIKAKLFTDIAPIGAENFIRLAEYGYYEGLNIHRVIEDFMMQGGSLSGDGTGGTVAYTGEGSDADDFGVEIDSRARHFYGALCYANALGRNDAQFYIVNNNQQDVLSELPDTEQIKEAALSFGEYLPYIEEGSLEYRYFENMKTYYTNLAAMIENMSQDVIDKYSAEGGTPMLDGGYTVFGQVYEGFDVIDAISAVEVETNDQGEESRPVQEIIIESVKIVTYE